MKTITLKNEHGETIEVKKGSAGEILVHHSDKDEAFGEFKEMKDTLSDPRFKKILAESELGKNPLAKEASASLASGGGAYLVIRGEMVFISNEEAAQIRDAAKQLG